jgi:hypothetical protein
MSAFFAAALCALRVALCSFRAVRRPFRVTLALFCAALGLLPAVPPVFAASAPAREVYVLEITSSGFTGSGAVVCAYKNVGQGDVFSQDIVVRNRTGRGCAVYLKSAEPLGDAALLDRLTFTFENARGGSPPLGGR